MEATRISEPFEVVPAKETITHEEAIRIIGRIGSILVNASECYVAITTRQPQLLASAIVRIYEDISAIKKMLET